MLVCAKCGSQMRCETNGVGADYGRGHVYPGDTYKCKTCGVLALHCIDNAVHDPDYTKFKQYVDCTKQNEINC